MHATCSIRLQARRGDIFKEDAGLCEVIQPSVTIGFTFGSV